MGVAIKITVQLKKSNTSGKKSEKSSNIISFSFIEDTKEENRRVKLVKSSFCRSENKTFVYFWTTTAKGDTFRRKNPFLRYIRKLIPPGVTDYQEERERKTIITTDEKQR